MLSNEQNCNSLNRNFKPQSSCIIHCLCFYLNTFIHLIINKAFPPCLCFFGITNTFSLLFVLFVNFTPEVNGLIECS